MDTWYTELVRQAGWIEERTAELLRQYKPASDRMSCELVSAVVLTRLRLALREVTR